MELWESVCLSYWGVLGVSTSQGVQGQRQLGCGAPTFKREVPDSLCPGSMLVRPETVTEACPGKEELTNTRPSIWVQTQQCGACPTRRSLTRTATPSMSSILLPLVVSNTPRKAADPQGVVGLKLLCRPLLVLSPGPPRFARASPVTLLLQVWVPGFSTCFSL